MRQAPADGCALSSDEGGNVETLAVNKHQYQTWPQLKRISKKATFNMPRFKESRTRAILRDVPLERLWRLFGSTPRAQR
ncbi:hypothetical protein RB195_012076 [Necator americanus]|uniref:Uncharacterized protein n=1 Tax=Necator americanus TaxID=51031 RepID=A0ABR1D6C7_NECAM